MLPVLHWFRWLAAVAALAGAMAAAVADPPARVGRLSLVEGEVTFRLNRQDEGGAATGNWPISSGAILDTGRNGRAEVQVGSSVFRLASDSRAEFATVDDGRIALQVARGSLAVTLRDRDQAGDIEIMTPAGQVSFGGAGRYRIDVDEDMVNIQVSARDGSAFVYLPGGEMAIPAGRRGTAYAGGGWYLGELYRDRFDAWADARDAKGDAALARRYVSPRMTGYEDLDSYGDWGSTADYGAVWYPRGMAADWAPYRYGRWAWVPPWGWTWVDEAPWGFAPFHYGRWFFLDGRWVWVPGTYVPRPVYAPALVAWVGNAGWSLGFDFGSTPAVGWFPLAPREVFIPAYHCSPTYLRQINIAHVTNVTVIRQAAADPGRVTSFANRSAPQAVTVVPATVVRSGQTVTPDRLIRPGRQEVRQAPITARLPQTRWLAPTEAALRPQRDDPRPPAEPPRPLAASPAPAPVATAPKAAGVPPPRAPEPLLGRAGRRGDSVVPPVSTPSPAPAAAAPAPMERRHEHPIPRPASPRDAHPVSPPLPRAPVAAAAAPPSVQEAPPRPEPRRGASREARDGRHEHGKPADAR